MQFRKLCLSNQRQIRKKQIKGTSIYNHELIGHIFNWLSMHFLVADILLEVMLVTNVRYNIKLVFIKRNCMCGTPLKLQHVVSLLVKNIFERWRKLDYSYLWVEPCKSSGAEISCSNSEINLKMLRSLTVFLQSGQYNAVNPKTTLKSTKYSQEYSWKLMQEHERKLSLIMETQLNFRSFNWFVWNIMKHYWHCNRIEYHSILDSKCGTLKWNINFAFELKCH